MVNVSYCVTVCNEVREIERLLEFLTDKIQFDDDVVVQYDSENVSMEVLEFLKLLNGMHWITVIGFPLNGNFSDFKNNLTKFAKGDYIMQIDADEVPNVFLIENLHSILDANPGMDLFIVPRINTVDGLTSDHVRKWGWLVNEKGWVNFPDFQTRIYRKSDDILWVGKVHERISGYNSYTYRPATEEYCLYHHKKIDKQEKQNSMYSKMI